MYTQADLVRIAKRENNNKRKYLVVNSLQGKHIPVSPDKAFAMFSAMADVFRNEYREEKLLLVGFAETATAIGAAVAMEIGAKYIQTTREVIPGVEYLFFSEEHSHATEQKLVKDDIDKVINDIDRIVFVEDEVTTGNTILNIIHILEKVYPNQVHYAVASILNGMNEDSLAEYAKRNIKLHYLVKTQHDEYTRIADSFKGDGSYISCNTAEVELEEIKVKNPVNARRITEAGEYQEACNRLWDEIKEKTNPARYGRVLVIGTEEFMYPALHIAAKLQECGVEVKCHSTTRSPIAVSSEEEYPLHVRYELRSLYDKERVTYLYDIDRYDWVLIVTDSDCSEQEGRNTLLNAVKMKNDKISLVRWC